MAKRKKTFVRHFRIYFRNNHPAYIVDEEGNLYVFHRVTTLPIQEAKRIGKRKTHFLVEAINRCILLSKSKKT